MTNRRTSLYTVTVQVPTRHYSEAYAIVARLAKEFDSTLSGTTLYPTGGDYQIAVTFRVPNDESARDLAALALRSQGLAQHPAEVHTGFGMHRRVVARQEQ